MTEYYTLVVEWKKLLPDSPGMIDPEVLINIIVNNNDPQLIDPKFYNIDIFLNYYSTLIALKNYSTNFNVKLVLVGDYNFLLFESLAALEFYQTQKQTSQEWIEYVAARDALIQLLGVESVTHSTRYSVSVEGTDYQTALTGLIATFNT